MRTAVQVPVIESERGWGSKIDDYMVCLSVEDANLFIKEFNAKNTASSAPDWYMQAENNVRPIDITNSQFVHLTEFKRAWKSELKNV